MARTQYQKKVAKVAAKVSARQAARGGKLKDAPPAAIRAKARGIIQKRKTSK